MSGWDESTDTQHPRLAHTQHDTLREISITAQSLFSEIESHLPEDRRAKSALATQSKPNLATDSIDSLDKLVALATRLPSLVNGNWPAKSRAILPASNPSTHSERTWAPILAWLILRALPETLDPPDLFDQLHLRRALAEIFATFGLEGESRWQAAAQVRLLLTPAATVPDAIRSAALFNDPDARWLAGVHDSAGITYFNKEQFEELLSWLQLPALLDIAALSDRSAQAARLTQLEASIAAVYAAARAAGYRLTDYLNSAGPPREPSTRKGASLATS